jgi:nucleotide-binding universal stress UspA family protein
MFDEILVCLDGSPLAEKILPLAQGIASGKGSTVVLLRVLGSSEELSAEESYMRERAGVLRAPMRFLISPDPATAIIEELEKNPRAMAALTTHGRTAWGEALLGSVALKVIRGARRPVLLYRARSDSSSAPAKITNLVVALDGSEFSEKIVPAAVAMASPSTAESCWFKLYARKAPRPREPTRRWATSSNLLTFRLRLLKSRNGTKSSRTGTCFTAKRVMRYAVM